MCKELKLVLGGAPWRQKVTMTMEDKKAIDVKLLRRRMTCSLPNAIKFYRGDFRGKDRGQN